MVHVLLLFLLAGLLQHMLQFLKVASEAGFVQEALLKNLRAAANAALDKIASAVESRTHQYRAIPTLSLYSLKLIVKLLHIFHAFVLWFLESELSVDRTKVLKTAAISFRQLSLTPLRIMLHVHRL